MSVQSSIESTQSGTASRRSPQSIQAEIEQLTGDRRLPPIGRKLAIDAVMLALATIATIVSEPLDGGSRDLIALVGFSIGVLAVLFHLGLYRSRLAPQFLDDARTILGATAIVALVMAFARDLFFDSPQATEQAARAWLFSSVYLIAAHGAMSLVEIRRRKLGVGGEPTLIVGAGTVGRQLAQRLLDRPEFGLRPVAFLDDDPLEMDDPVPGGIPVVSSAVGGGHTESFGPQLEAEIQEHGITNVVVGFSTSSHRAELDLVRRCQAMNVTVSVLPRLFEGVTDEITLERFGGIPMISVHPADPRGWGYAVKYLSDRVTAPILLLLLSPVLIAAAIATWISLGRPILFKQRRVGVDGREFNLLKFRTMRPPKTGEAVEADLDDRLSLGLAPGGVEGADRRTRVGAFLRKSSIDELPQLINVLRGDMSLVGPRPERPSYARLYDESVYRYADRHRVKSGITGWAQINGLRGSTSIADRVEWDNYYIENRSVWLDLKILLLTIPAMLGDRAE